jgi:tripartite-type tricarboxylate transporter receptor subunit TctC
MSALRVAAVAAGIALMASGCGATGKTAAGPSTSGASVAPLTGLRIMVPNTAGGGYDTTARAAAKVLDDETLAPNTEVFNLAGAGGTVGLARVVNEKGNGDLAMLMGLGVVGASYTNKSESKLTDTTPLARLIEEPGAIMVSKDSPYKTIDDLVAAWKKDPSKVSVGGGSSPGGPDHLLPMQLAGAVGIDATKVNFVSYDGGGDLLPAIIGNKLGFAASGAGDAETIDESQARPQQRMVEQCIAERAGRQERDECGKGANVSDTADGAPRAQRADHQPGEIGSRHGADDDGALSRSLKPQTEQRRHETAARHQHEDGEQQCRYGFRGSQHWPSKLSAPGGV